jgi:hypothetical protein
MTTKLQEAQMVSTKSEREAISLREGFQAYKEMQKKEVAEIKAEFRGLVERSKGEADEAVSRGGGGGVVRLKASSLDHSRM